MDKDRLSTLATTAQDDDPKVWVHRKFDVGDNKALLRHLLAQIKALDLKEADRAVDLLRKSVRAQANHAAIFSNFASIVDDHMPIDVPTSDLATFHPGFDDDHENWRQRKADTATTLIEKGMTELRKFPFNTFWDGKLWDRLRYNHSQDMLLEDGVALLEVILSDVPVSQRESLIAKALAGRFGEDIVKAEIVADKRCALVVPPESVVVGAGKLDELRKILQLFIVIAEGDGLKCYPDTFTISWSWGEKILDEVSRGNDELFRDLRGLVPICMKGSEYEAYNAMASILSKYFPSIVIGGLTPATEIVKRGNQRGGQDWPAHWPEPADVDSRFFDFIKGR